MQLKLIMCRFQIRSQLDLGLVYIYAPYVSSLSHPSLVSSIVVTNGATHISTLCVARLEIWQLNRHRVHDRLFFSPFEQLHIHDKRYISLLMALHFKFYMPVGYISNVYTEDIPKTVNCCFGLVCLYALV